METIKNYLETMFANLPNTESVRKAKAELLQMMEDKYYELRADGYTENAAVGEVIANFGNLDELAEILNIQDDIKEATKEQAARPRRFVSFDEVKEYLHDVVHYGIMLSTAIFLCIVCVVPPILGDEYDWPDWACVASMFILVGIAIGLFICRHIMMKKWNFLRGTFCQTDMMTSQYVADQQKNYTSTHAIRLTIGIVLCALCWLPAAVLDDVSGLGDLSAAMLFILVALGVFMIVITNAIMNSYERVLKLNDANTVSGAYVESLKPVYINDGVALMMDLLWPTFTAIYLIWSFITFDWWKTWIIWPIAGIIRAVLKANLTKKD